MRGFGLISLLRFIFVFFMISFMSFRVFGGIMIRYVNGGIEVFDVMMEGVIGDGRIDDGEVNYN